MGMCYEFGCSIAEGCEHPMQPESSSCRCPICESSCPGRFAGCTDVWERGPQPVDLVVIEDVPPPGAEHEGGDRVADAEAIVDDLERLHSDLSGDRAALRAEASALFESLAAEEARGWQEWRDEAEVVVTAVLRHQSEVLADLRTEVVSALAEAQREQADLRDQVQAALATFEHLADALLGPAHDTHDCRIERLRRELGRWLDDAITPSGENRPIPDTDGARLNALRYQLLPGSSESAPG